MANFDLALESTLKAEGGYVFDKDDLGGETYKGIARSRNPKWEGWVSIDILKNKRNFPQNLDNDEILQTQI